MEEIEKKGGKGSTGGPRRAQGMGEKQGNRGNEVVGGPGLGGISQDQGRRNQN